MPCSRLLTQSAGGGQGAAVSWSRDHSLAGLKLRYVTGGVDMPTKPLVSANTASDFIKPCLALRCT